MADPGIIWITSYPKSGNTWMRFLLARLMFGNIRTSADVDTLIPNVGGSPGEQVALPEDSPVMLKTHWTFSNSEPLFSRTLGFVYIVRNPLDVMLSFFNFNLLRFMDAEQALSRPAIAAARARYIDTFIRERGNPLRDADAGHTDWVENVRQWRLAGERYPSVFVRYEDMLKDTEREMRRVLTFLQRAVPDDVLRDAIDKSSFESMKQQEEREIHDRTPGFFYRRDFENAQRRGIRFMHQGKANAAARTLTERQRDAFAKAFEETLQSLGYRFDPRTGETHLDEGPLGTVKPLDADVGDFGRALVQS